MGIVTVVPLADRPAKPADDEAPGQSAFVAAPPTSAEVSEFVHYILKGAETKNCDSAVVVMAMADALATIAGSLDRQVGRQPFDDRLDTFIARARETYRRMK